MEPRGEGQGGHVVNIVAQVTAKALREFDTGDMDNATGDHDPSATRVGSDQVANMPVADTQDRLDYSVEDDGHDDDSDVSDADLESNEQTILDPEHPLMKRYQKRLREILRNRENVLEAELKEVHQGVARKKKEREDVGVELYGIQQELARHQLTLENLQVC